MSKLSGVLTKQTFTTHAEGETCVLTIGNAELRFGYADGFKLSQAIRVTCKEAKANAGDTARHWSVLGVMDDANVG